MVTTKMNDSFPEELSLPTNFWFWSLFLEITIFAGIWSCLYKLSTIYFSKRSPEWSSRAVTLVHAATVTIGSTWAVFVVGPFPIGLASSLQPNSFHNHVLAISLSYFIFDTAWCLYYRTEGVTMLCHHVTSVFAMIAILFLQECVVCSVAALGLGEFTNPVLQARWFIREMKIKSTALPLIVDATFAISFFICRFIFLSIITYYLLIDPKVRIVMKVMNIVLSIVSIIFMFQIINAARKTLRRHQKSN